MVAPRNTSKVVFLGTAKEALEAGFGKYYDGRPCKFGHTSGRYASNDVCVQCSKDHAKRRALADPEGTKARKKKWDEDNVEYVKEYNRRRHLETYPENAEKIKARRKEAYWADPVKARAAGKAWRVRNAEYKAQKGAEWYAANREAVCKRSRQWALDHPAQVRALSSARRARLLQATPQWVDKEALKDVYVYAVDISEETGIEHHVDHIVPLRNKNVCGLHVPWNLRVIPKTENLKKYNKFNPNTALLIESFVDMMKEDDVAA